MLASLLLPMMALQSSQPQRAYKIPPALSRGGWEEVSAIPFWVRLDSKAVLTVSYPPERLGVEYKRGNGQTQVRSDVSFAPGDERRYAYRTVGLYADGSTKDLGPKTPFTSGRLTDLRVLYILRRPRSAMPKTPQARLRTNPMKNRVSMAAMVTLTCSRSLGRPCSGPPRPGG